MIFPRDITYIRHGWLHPYSVVRDAPTQSGHLLIFDAVGERTAELLSLRLKRLPEWARHPTHIVLRGLSPFLQQTLENDGIASMFPSAKGIYELQKNNGIQIVPLLGFDTIDESDYNHLAALVRQTEMEAILTWSGAVWRATQFHFVLPSGEHSDLFVRIGDAFLDWLNVSRVADWFESELSPHCALLADTGTLLPLLQELEIRLLRKNPAAKVLKRTLPIYRLSREELNEIIAECIGWAEDGGELGSLISFVSVNASGSYLKRLEAAIQRAYSAFGEPKERTRVIVLCDVNAESDTSPMSRFVGRRFANKAECELCTAGVSKIEIDQQRFTTRILAGVETLKLPTATLIEQHADIITALDREGAFKVHSDRPDHHGHLGIYIDPQQALRSQAFQQKALEALQRTLVHGCPDLVLIPEHTNSATLQDWIHSHGVDGTIVVPHIDPTPEKVTSRISNARDILLLDDAIISGRTFRSILQLVQRVKGESNDSNYRVRGLCLIARTADASTWKGMKGTFYINHHNWLEAAWNIHLPDWGQGCPWCVEKVALEDLLPDASALSGMYLDLRLQRLQDPEGLTGQIFLGSEFAQPGSFDEGTHVTPHSYLGDLSDSGAFVASCILFQQLRSAWRSRPESLITRYVFPTDLILERFRDPAIAAAMLRAAYPGELVANETVQNVERAMADSQHFRQHPVFIAELLWAAQRQKLPPETVFRLYADRLNLLEPSVKSVLFQLMD